MGDSSQSTDDRYDGLLTFDLSGLPPSLVELSEGRLELPVNQVFGEPFATLGVLNLEYVIFSEIGPEATRAAAFAVAGSIAPVGVGEEGTALTTEVLAASLQASTSRVQYRLRFSTATDADGATDLVVFSRANFGLGLTYLLP